MGQKDWTKQLQDAGFIKQDTGVWSVGRVDILGGTYSLQLSPVVDYEADRVTEEFCLWWLDWHNCQMEGDEIIIGDFDTVAKEALETKALADAEHWEELGFEYFAGYDGYWDEEIVEADTKADVMKEDTAEQTTLF